MKLKRLGPKHNTGEHFAHDCRLAEAYNQPAHDSGDDDEQKQLGEQ
jgi:hypothetical protein